MKYSLYFFLPGYLKAQELVVSDLGLSGCKAWISFFAFGKSLGVCLSGF